jgi:hypothetical protein
MISRHEAISIVDDICNEQLVKHGTHQHDIPEWLIIIRRQLQKMEDAWYRGEKTEALIRVGHVAACAVTAIEQNAVKKSDIASLKP